MIKYNFRLSVALIILLFSYNSVLAEGKWWQKAINIFKSQKVNRTSDNLSSDEIGAAFKEALRIGSETVVEKLGAVNGFNADSNVRIPLPNELSKVKKMLSKLGMSQLVDDLEVKLNRAAEAATPKAKELFKQSIKEMTFDDIMGIYKGSEDSATEYFKEKMSQSLSSEMHPIVEQSLSNVGAIKAYSNVMDKYNKLPFVPDIDTNLTDHVVQKAMDGIFSYLAKEESAIRNDPVKQTTDLLKKVFGTQ